VEQSQTSPRTSSSRTAQKGKAPKQGAQCLVLQKERRSAAVKNAGQEVTYHVGLRLAVVALRVEAVTLALGGGGLEVRWDCTGGHIVCVWECEVE
jgi:hypothetical protein